MTDTSNVGAAENIELDDMAQRTNDAIGDIMRDVENTADDSMGQFTFRELRGLDQTMRTIRGNLAYQESQRITVQHTITSLERDLTI